VSPPIDDGRAMNVARFSRLYDGQGVHSVYMAERVIHQLGLVQKWRDGLFYSKRLEADDDFEGY
jgi:hypothetical protein